MSLVIKKIKREWVALLAKIRLKRAKVNYLGMQLSVPVVYGVFNGGYFVPHEFWMGECLRAFLNTKTGTVLDVGVNVGLYLVKLRCHSLDRQYIGFEPNPICIFYTQELIRLNGFKNTMVLPTALSDSEGIAQFYASKAGDKTGSLILEHKAGQDLAYSFNVVTMLGDHMVKMLGLTEIAAIKIDVEEAEIYTLRGLSQTIAQFKPYIYCEILFAHGDVVRKQRADEIYNFITALGYLVLGIQRTTQQLDVVSNIADVGVNYEQEYIFCPKELLKDFRQAIANNTANVAINI